MKRVGKTIYYSLFSVAAPLLVDVCWDGLEDWERCRWSYPKSRESMEEESVRREASTMATSGMRMATKDTVSP